MKKIVAALFFFSTWITWAQTSTVNLSSEKQYIRGFGGINHPEWAGDLTAAQRTTAFGNGAGQMGFTILRIFINDDKTQWSKALPTAKYAQSLGVTIFATPWNPPASMCETVTRNNRQEKRLKYDSYSAYAQHLIDFNNYMKNNGVNLYAMSFANEPDWGFDWTWYSIDEVYNFTKNIAGTLRVNGIKVITAESFSYNKSYYDKVLNDPVALANIDIIGTHLYGSDANSPVSLYNYPLADSKAPGKERWMTEHYTNSDANSADIWPDANDVSYEIYRCMVEGQMSVYTWWYIRRQYSPMKEDGTISKRGYCMAQYSKFIRPGYVRVDATKNPVSGVYVSAYKKGDDVVVVAVNRSTSSQTITVSVPGTKVTTWEKYVTSGSKSLAKETNINSNTGSFQITLDPQSTTSFVGTAPVVTNPVPVVTLTAPTNNTVYTEGDNVTITATATITSGSISKVDFYNGTTLLGSDATSPYTYTITGAAAGNYVLTAAATSALNAASTSSAVNIQVAKPIYQTGSAPTIDGTVDALWSNFNSVSIAKNNSGTISSAADLSGNWKAMWDATNLYVLVQVTDDVKRNDGGTDVYNDDGVEVYIDMGNTKATTYGSNDQQYTFRWNDATAVYEINGHSVAGITRGITNTSTGYIVEVSIPWSTMGGTASVNALEGFEVMISDDDDGGARDGKLAWIATTDDTWSNPSLMGTVILKGLNCTAPTATITTTTPTTFCSGGSVLLTASAGTGYGYVWKNGTTTIGGATAQTYTATAAGSYTVTVTNSGGCSATSAATTVTVNALPAAAITVQGNTTFCAGGSVTLNANTGTGLTYQWYNGTNPAGNGNASLSLYVSSGSFTVKVTDANGCSSTSAPVVVTINAVPNAPAVTSPVSYCQNASAVPLTATGSNLKWYADNTTATALGSAPTPLTISAGTTNYFVSQTTNGCESSRSQIAVTVNALPTAVITTTTPTTFCQGGSVVLTASSGSSYKWMNGTTQVGTSQSYTATTSGSYTVEVTNANGCKATSSVTTVTVNALPTAAITTTTPTAFCQGGNVVLTASAGSSYKWMNGTTQVGTAQTYTATAAGSYMVEVTNANTCKATSTATIVTVNALPTAPGVASPVSYCQNVSAVPLTATGSNLKWYADNTTATALGSAPTPVTTSAGTTNYFVSQTTNGCESSRSQIAVTVNALPTAAITTTTPTTFCQGGNVVLTASAGSSYKWMNGTTQVGTAQSYTATAAGSYTVEVTNAGNCSATSAATTVTVNALPTATITASGPTAIPQGGSVGLTANTGSGFTYKWFNGTTQVGTSQTYTATVAGAYTVEVTNGNSCSATSAVTTVSINTNQPSVITITSPVANATITGAIDIAVNVTDPDGSITLVEFLDGNTVIGTSSTAPYVYTWDNPSEGSHTITVRVTDSNGGVTTSAPTVITSTTSTGVQGSNTLNANIYPNPSNGIVFVDSDEDLSGASFMLIDVMGNEHAVSQTANGMGSQVDVSNLSDGTYILIVKKNDSVMRKKITVIK